MQVASGPKGYENFTQLSNLRKSFRRLSVSHRRKSEVAPVPQALRLKQMQTQTSYSEDIENSSDASHAISDKSNDQTVISNQPQSRNQPESRNNEGSHAVPSKGNLIIQLGNFGHSYTPLFISCNHISTYF